MEEGEVRAVAEIARDEIYDELTAKEVEEWLKNSGNYPYLQHFVAEEDGEIVGFISWGLYDRYAKQIILEIAWMAIEEERQGRGIGKELLEKSLKEVKDSWRGLQVVAIIVDTDEENRKAQRFYERTLRPFQKVVIPKVWSDGEGTIIYFARPRT